MCQLTATGHRRITPVRSFRLVLQSAEDSNKHCSAAGRLQGCRCHCDQSSSWTMNPSSVLPLFNMYLIVPLLGMAVALVTPALRTLLDQEIQSITELSQCV